MNIKSHYNVYDVFILQSKLNRERRIHFIVVIILFCVKHFQNTHTRLPFFKEKYSIHNTTKIDVFSR